mmetsp:Transcript_104673/g.207939  ORF Transcript_104673/g.207939 Transcript_104673/m.207939 type:complete len:262 (+) Transcript_104673:113-898(+)
MGSALLRSLLWMLLMWPSVFVTASGGSSECMKKYPSPKHLPPASDPSCSVELGLFASVLMICLFLMGAVGVVQSTRAKAMMAALNDAAQGDSVDAYIERHEGNYVCFSFTAMRLDGVTCRVKAANEISKANAALGRLSDMPVDSMQKVMYLRADPKICRLEKVAMIEGTGCNDILIVFGCALLLGASAIMLTLVANGLDNRVLIWCAISPLAVVCLMVIAGIYGRGPCFFIDLMTSNVATAVQLTEVDERGIQLLPRLGAW